MKIWVRTTMVVASAALAAWLTLSVPDAMLAQAPSEAKGKAGRFAQDPGAQARAYHFEDPNEDLPYSVYVSSKVRKDQKAPLVVTLHGLGAPQTPMMGAAAIDLGGGGWIILVAPVGYNTSGWYGSPGVAGGGRGKGKGAPGTKGTPDEATGAAANGPGADAAKGKAGFGGGNQPASVIELSERDAMNVIAMVRKEFNIDDKRIYIMGHSMGGAGASS